MGDRQPRAQRRAMAAIEQEEIFGQTITQAGPNSAPDIFAGPAGAEALAFEAQECNLVVWVHGSQTWVELKTVDDPDRITKPDVLGTQITVPIDDATAINAFNKHVAVAIEKAALDEVDPPDQPCRKGKAVTEQDPPVIRQTATPIAEVKRRREQ